MELEIVDDKERRQRAVYFDIMRIVACFFVIFNHTNQKGFFLFSTYPWGSARYWICMAISVFCTFSVPLFFAISGALTLGRDTRRGEIANGIIKYASVLIGLSIFYYLIKGIKYKTELSAVDFFKKLYTAQIATHLWFLYAFLVLIVSRPFLRAIVKVIHKKQYKLIILLAFVFLGVIPVLEYAFSKGEIGITKHIQPSWLMQNIVLYPLVGYYLEHHVNIEKLSKKRIACIWGLNILLILVSCYMTHVRGLDMGEINEKKSQVFFSSFVLVNMISVFLTVKKLFYQSSGSSRGWKAVLSISASTFFIYLFHVAVKANTIMEGIYNAIISTGMKKIIASILWCGIIFCITYGISLIIKRIPGVRKLFFKP